MCIAKHVGLAALFLFSAVGCSLTRPKLHAASIDLTPRPNRVIELNTVWARAKPLNVTVHGPIHGESRSITLRAIHDGRALSILATWPDYSGADESRRVWAWDEREQQYITNMADERLTWNWDTDSDSYRLRRIETDFFSVKFCISGSESACMMDGSQGVYDVWIWRAGWTHIFGFAEDRTLTITREPSPDGSTQQFYGNDEEHPIYLQWRDDAGELPFIYKQAPSRFDGPRLLGILARNPTGSTGDVLAEAVYEPAIRTWKLELMRILNTEHDDDYAIDGRGPHLFSIAIGDNQEGQGHYTSDLIALYLD